MYTRDSGWKSSSAKAKRCFPNWPNTLRDKSVNDFTKRGVAESGAGCARNEEKTTRCVWTGSKSAIKILSSSNIAQRCRWTLDTMACPIRLVRFSRKYPSYEITCSIACYRITLLESRSISSIGDFRYLQSESIALERSGRNTDLFVNEERAKREWIMSRREEQILTFTPFPRVFFNKIPDGPFCRGRWPLARSA